MRMSICYRNQTENMNSVSYLKKRNLPQNSEGHVLALWHSLEVSLAPQGLYPLLTLPSCVISVSLSVKWRRENSTWACKECLISLTARVMKFLGNIIPGGWMVQPWPSVCHLGATEISSIIYIPVYSKLSQWYSSLDPLATLTKKQLATDPDEIRI